MSVATSPFAEWAQKASQSEVVTIVIQDMLRVNPGLRGEELISGLKWEGPLPPGLSPTIPRQDPSFLDELHRLDRFSSGPPKKTASSGDLAGGSFAWWWDLSRDDFLTGIPSTH